MSTVLAGYGLVKKYGSTTALAGVDMEVRERDSLAIMGPSGSGKSTLLHTLAPGSSGPTAARCCCAASAWTIWARTS